ncbi:PREDICTED: FUN14 domain-containing protein 2 [Gavialis gangeticus]|uniref:FUN14 domain-containing protein 2 n=1 Tax=Gavialis gangeticus TaxID=94835 RepID=UPI00092EE296|nr:PREDICTED: FUN14 domain-containing protein 2 [Gavialis gangeticus]
MDESHTKTRIMGAMNRLVQEWLVGQGELTRRFMVTDNGDQLANKLGLFAQWCHIAKLHALRLTFIFIFTGKNEDSYKVLDLTEYTKNQSWWRKLFAPHSGSSAEKYNVATQLVIGGVTGWCTGFIFQKVGKLAATAVGGGFFLLQIANHKGYIKVDWKLVERDVNKAKQQLKFHSSGHPLIPETKSRADEVITFLKKNVILTGGFAGGFLLGMAS